MKVQNKGQVEFGRITHGKIPGTRNFPPGKKNYIVQLKCTTDLRFPGIKHVWFWAPLPQTEIYGFRESTFARFNMSDSDSEKVNF